MERTPKHGRKTALIVILLAIVLLLGGVVGALFLRSGGDSQPTESTAPTEETPTTENDVTLFYNVDREKYAGKGEDGKTGRSIDPDTGYYHIRLAGGGRAAERRFADLKLATKADAEEVMALVTDETGLATDIIKVEDCTGGYYMGGKRLYVSDVDGNKLTLHGYIDLQGSAYPLTLDENTKIYDVSDLAEANESLGSVTTLRELDRILAIFDYDGSVGWVFVTDRESSAGKETRYCEHCKQEVTWYAWADSHSLPNSGERHYFLTTDVESLTQTSLAEDASIVLDLNGHTVTGGSGKRIYSIHNTGSFLAIMDTSEQQTGKLVAAKCDNMTDEAACVWLRYGNFELYGGTLDASAVNGTKPGVAIYVRPDTTFTMYGGTIIGGTTTTQYDATKKSSNGGLGGAIFVNGTFNMHGGTISGGTAKAYWLDGNAKNGRGGAVTVGATGVMVMDGGTITGGTSEGGGGNLYLGKGAVFTMSGSASIVNGDNIGKSQNGGNVFISTGATLTMNGGSITGGTTRNGGGNVYLNGTLNMYGGVIRDGRKLDYNTGAETPSNTENVHLVNGTLNMTGGLIAGHMTLVATGEKSYTVNLSGAAQIKGAQDGQPNLKIANGMPIHVGTLSQGAEIWVTADGVFTTATDAANKAYFHGDNGTDVNRNSDGCLFVGRMQCVCGASQNGGEHVGDCDKTLHVYKAWTSNTTIPTESGYYYLTKDVTVSKQAAVAKNAAVCLDLNGHTVTGEAGKRIYSVHNEGSTLALADSGENGKLLAAKCDSMTDEGACVWVRYGTLKLYGGTLDASEVTATKSGTAVYVRPDTTFTMYGGTIIGGTSATSYDESKNSASGGMGGAVFVNGTFNMHGGTISGGTAKAYWLEDSAKNGRGGAVTVGATGVAVMDGGVIQDGTADGGGGNLYLGSGASFTMSGSAAIVNGETVGKGQNGGSIYVAKGATLTMNGGSVTGGTGRNGGGNLALYGTLNMNGGVIKDGRILDFETGNEVAKHHENLFVVNGTLNMTGGLIAGHAQLIASGGEFTANLSGTAQIKGAADGMGNLYIPNGKTVNVGTMSEGAEVWVTASGVFTTATDAANKAYFHSDSDIDRNADGCLFMGRMQCVCGASQNGGEHVGDCDKTLHAYTAWTSTTTLPTESGYYYLTKDVNPSGQNDVKAGASVCLDLNGHTVNGKEGGRIYSLTKDTASALSIADSVGTGKLVATGTSTTQGTCLTVAGAAHSVKLYGGTYDASGVTYTGDRGGTVLYVNHAEAEVKIFDGTLIGGKATHEKAVGGSVYLKGKLTMSGGTISGGTAPNGGNVAVLDGGSFEMSGGTISDGTATNGGGNVYVDGALNISGGTVADGNAKNGGNVYLNGTLSMVGGNIGDGIAGTSGGNLYLAADASATLRGTVTGGTAKLGGNLALGGANASLTVAENAKISDGKITEASGQRGNEIYVLNTATNASVGMTGGEIDGSNGKNGAVALYAGSFAMSGGTLKGNADAGTNHGAAVYLGKGTKLTASGDAQIVGGKAANGGSVYVSGGAALELSDSASVNGGTATKGGNICVLGGDAENEGLTMTGSSTVEGGTAETAGANVYLAGGKLTMSGGTISGGFTACKKGEQLPVMKLSGNATIWNNAAEGAELSDGAIFNIESGFVGTVYLTNAPTVGTTLKVAAKTEGDTADYTDRIRADADHIVLAEGNDYVLYHRDEHIHCLCGAWTSRSDTAVTHAEGCDETPHVYTAWTSNTTLPTTSGYYYLTENVNLNGQATVAAGANIRLDLNGHTVNGKEKGRIYMLSSSEKCSLSISDCRGTGKLIATGTSTTQGACLTVAGAAYSVKLYGGTYDASGVTYTGDRGGTVLYVNHTEAEVKIFDGTLIGGKATHEKATGGSVYLKGKLTMSGGTVKDGTATNGGNVAVLDGGTFEMTGGTIKDGTATNGGGNVYVDGALNISGGAVTGGNAKNGGNVYLNGGSLTLNDSEVGGGKASGSNGGNIYVGKAKLTVNNSTITGGTSTRGGNLCLGANANVTLNGATVTGGSAAIGGNIAILGANASLTVAEDSKISGGIITATDTNYQRGNEIYVIKTATNASVSMTGGEIDGGNDARTAVVVFVGSFRMSGGTLKGDVNVSDGVTVKLSGAPKLSANANGKALILNGNAAMLEGLTDGASIAVTVTAAGKTVATGATEADVSRFVSTDSAYELVFDSTDSTIKSAARAALPD